MHRENSRLRRLLLSAIAFVLIGGVFASEIPEELALTNDTSNDYILRSPTVFKSVQLVPSSRDNTELLLISAPSSPKLQVPPTTQETRELHRESLFILHSVLRT
jgi:hypothetical protein